MRTETDIVDQLLTDLFPLPRSITGDGTRATLARIAREIPLTLFEVPSGSPALDWTVPDEWNLRRGLLLGPDGTIVADTEDSWLHVVNYSQPTAGRYTLDELAPHLHSLPDRPHAVPYRTTYYTRDWGFCLPDATRAALEPGTYEVSVDATLAPGALTYGELVVPGRSREEVLVSAHVCHPAMANDNLSGIAAAVALARWAMAEDRALTYRFVFAPATIGALAWLAGHRDELARIRHGLVLSGLGDPGALTYKPTRGGDRPVDRAMAALLRGRGAVLDWHPYGYDERQYGSPGFDLSVGRLSRSVHGSYPEYHTSDDNLDFVSAARILEAADVVLELFEVLESGLVPRSLAPYGEPHLGKTGLYRAMGGTVDRRSAEMVYLWILGLADGDHDLIRIAERSGLPLAEVATAARALRSAGVLADHAPPEAAP